MYQLYVGNKNYSSWSLRPWVLMRELGIPFEEHVVPLDPGTSWTKFRAFSPTGRVPCPKSEGLKKMFPLINLLLPPKVKDNRDDYHNRHDSEILQQDPGRCPFLPTSMGNNGQFFQNGSIP